MQPTAGPRVKICCISSVEEAQTAVRYGASALGLVSSMPSGPGVIGEDLIAEIAATIPPGVASFLLTSKQDAQSIIEQQRRTRVNTIQICDSLEREHYQRLRAALPGVALVQVIHVRGPESMQEARSVAPYVDGILLDSGNQSLAVKELGGTGRTHDWTVSNKIREAVEVPVFLAGGLNAGNVSEALDKVHPYALDLCNGVRTNGKLDEEKLSAFFHQIRQWTSQRESM
ncbi:MAG: Phosphoribosylanthranilate isomerase [Bacteroidetes bacterium]|nr:Phosphoribosylanthranilate isomerase [Bacteroidota bacterium]